MAPAEALDPLAEPESTASPEAPAETAPPAGPAPEKPKTVIQTEQKPAAPAPQKDTAGTTERPATPESGAKSRSTVFDPNLAKKLARERHKVRKFKSEDDNYRTATGTFVQQGDRCWEVLQLVSGDTSSESSQWLRRKCPGASRSKSDIDRLARKYGIP
ncbi:hypothetical protein [Microbulbifer halophilus]|uniref:LysM domain-containing protein n=1 Tax=Microbulbifer halophilus TaxID=453963 RepID=A0ABW5EBS7_9GAMM|nr:hypothetical protein [Microbulbifer halophilus]MCW8126532.1 hypothetical protein [Microbulbifer halophilus]